MSDPGRTHSRDERVAAVEAVIDARIDSAMIDWWPDTHEWAEGIIDALDALSSPARTSSPG